MYQQKSVILSTSTFMKFTTFPLLMPRFLTERVFRYIATIRAARTRIPIDEPRNTIAAESVIQLSLQRRR
ncbi:hypothetical protein Syun_024416 [Stephania yunnanensis]|uniref:Uncharacterized protein n=1 Tax=Stephania yunnanensis TaxID=152371 RepID=A0AAP0I4E2_9MAGN